MRMSMDSPMIRSVKLTRSVKRMLLPVLAACLYFGTCSIPLAIADTNHSASDHDHDHGHDHGPHTDSSKSVATPPTLPSQPIALTAGYCLLIVIVSMLGGSLPFRTRLTHMRMQMIISFVGGLMLGIGLLHMLPHAVAILGPGSIDRIVQWILCGLLVMFFLLRMFHFHQHEPIDHACDDCSHPDTPEEAGEQTSEPAVAHAHSHIHDHAKPVHQLSWIGVAIGLSLHTLIDGLALGAAVQADVGHETLLGLFGLGTFLAVLLHKPLDAVSITSLMIAGGWSRVACRLVNLGFALMCPLGAALFVLGMQRFSSVQADLIGCALAFSAGVFLCISLGDLLPEMEFHSHNRLPLTIALLAGIALAWGIGFLEPEHAHGHADTQPQQVGQFQEHAETHRG